MIGTWLGSLFFALTPPLPAKPAPQEIEPAAPLIAENGRLELSLDECVHQVLTRNLGLKIAQIGTAENRASILEALGAFDPELYASASGGVSKEPTASSFQSPKNQSLNGRTGIRGLASTGLTYDLGYTVNYNRQSPANPFFGLNPTVVSGLSLSLAQPLLRGAGTTVTEAPVEQAKLLVARGDLDLYAQVQSVAFLAVEAYWIYVRVLRERDTAKTALEVADELVANNQKRLDASAMTRLDVLTTQAEAARRKKKLIRTENSVKRAEDALKFLLSPGGDLKDWSVTLVPTTPPQLRDDPPVDEEATVQEAFLSRADLQALESDVAAAELNVTVARDAVLPKFDLIGSYGLGGLGGNSPGATSDPNRSLWWDSVEPIGRGDFPTWTLGFDFSHPIGNRTAEASQHRAELVKQRADMTWLQKRMQIVQEMRGALRDVVDARASSEATTQARVLSQEQYQAEVVRLENQHSTTFQVREVQRDLVEAEDAETASITDYEITRAALERAKGTLAQRYGVQFVLEARRAGDRRD